MESFSVETYHKHVLETFWCRLIFPCRMTEWMDDSHGYQPGIYIVRVHLIENSIERQLWGSGCRIYIKELAPRSRPNQRIHKPFHPINVRPGPPSYASGLNRFLF